MSRTQSGWEDFIAAFLKVDKRAGDGREDEGPEPGKENSAGWGKAHRETLSGVDVYAEQSGC